MRVTISHNKGQQEAIRIVDGAADQVLRPDLPGLMQVIDVHKSWNGSTMTFSLKAKMGFVRVPIHGTIFVTDKDITIDCELPALLTKLVPEKTIQAGVESKIRGLLKA